MLILLFTLFSFQAQAQSFIPQGLWAQGCHIDGDDMLDMRIQIQGESLTLQGYGFEDADCKQPYIFYEEVYSVQSFLPASTDTHDYEVNLETKEMAYTPLTDEVARALNEGSFCGMTNWKVKVKTFVTGGNCNDENLKRKGEIYFQSVRLQQDAPTSLFWGLTNHTLDGSSADKRPHNYEALPYLKISRDFNKLM